MNLQESIEQASAYHKTNRRMSGKVLRKYLAQVDDLVSEVHPADALDYGCGRAHIWYDIDKELVVRWQLSRVQLYDPAISIFSRRPEPADLVICCHVLEHVPPEHVVGVAADMLGLARLAAFVAVPTKPSRETLPNGQNAHLTVRPKEWWERTIGEIAHPNPDFKLRLVIE